MLVKFKDNTLKNKFSLCFVVLFFSYAVFSFAYAAPQGSDLWVERKDNAEIIPASKLPSFASAIDELGKAVVNIRTKGKVKSKRGALGVDPLEQLFGCLLYTSDAADE